MKNDQKFRNLENNFFSKLNLEFCTSLFTMITGGDVEPMYRKSKQKSFQGPLRQIGLMLILFPDGTNGGDEKKSG